MPFCVNVKGNTANKSFGCTVLSTWQDLGNSQRRAKWQQQNQTLALTWHLSGKYGCLCAPSSCQGTITSVEFRGRDVHGHQLQCFLKSRYRDKKAFSSMREACHFSVKRIAFVVTSIRKTELP